MSEIETNNPLDTNFTPTRSEQIKKTLANALSDITGSGDCGFQLLRAKCFSIEMDQSEIRVSMESNDGWETTHTLNYAMLE